MKVPQQPQGPRQLLYCCFTIPRACFSLHNPRLLIATAAFTLAGRKKRTGVGGRTRLQEVMHPAENSIIIKDVENRYWVAISAQVESVPHFL